MFVEKLKSKINKKFSHLLAAQNKKWITFNYNF